MVSNGDNEVASAIDDTEVPLLLNNDNIDCLEHKGDMSSFHNFTGDAKETFELVL